MLSPRQLVSRREAKTSREGIEAVTDGPACVAIAQPDPLSDDLGLASNAFDMVSIEK